MAQSFLIFIVVVVVIAIVIAAVVGTALFMHFIVAGVLLLISAVLIMAGFSMLASWGGAVGAVGIFLMLIGGLVGWLAIRAFKGAIEEQERRRM